MHTQSGQDGTARNDVWRALCHADQVAGTPLRVPCSTVQALAADARAHLRNEHEAAAGAATAA